MPSPSFRALAAVLHTPARRIAFAVALSALAHAAILWLPPLHLPGGKVQLPPLTARLELQPRQAAQPAGAAESAKKSVKSTSLPGSEAHPKDMAKAASEMKEMKKSATRRLFPRHTHLIFVIHKDGNVFREGELHHQLDIHGDSYSLESIRQTVGLTGMPARIELVQDSRGKIGEHGLQPESYREEGVANGGKRLKTAFDRAAGKLLFPDGSTASLPEGVQDALSFMYQLSQLPMNREIVPLPIGNVAHIENCQLEVGGEESIDTPMGILRTLRLRKMHERDEPYFEIWLGMEYRMLPVRLRQVDAAGATIEELVISDLRASEE